MTIVVVGGRGRIGARLVAELTRGGHDVIAASRRLGIDALTGEGLAALSGDEAALGEIRFEDWLRRVA